MSNPFLRGVQNLFGGGGEEGGDRRNARRSAPQQRQQQQPRSNQQQRRPPPANNNNHANQLDLDSLFSSIFGSADQAFEAATQAAMRASMQDQQQRPPGPPPTSKRALRDLPMIRICTEDLVDPVNRECCVCLEAHELGKTAVRLPCAHIFHKECILDWLKAHNTCPVCRYELPTDNVQYEQERVKRMRHRKPRFARHELERLTTKQLKQLLNDHYHAVDRNDLIHHLIQSGAIDLIASPEPVEYSLSALRQMGVTQLKRCMNEEAGVFFDPKDVVEKEDMIRIFQASGRLHILPEDVDTHDSSTNTPPFQSTTTSSSSSAAMDVPSNMSTNMPSAPLVETVLDDSTDTAPSVPPMDLRTDTTLVMEEAASFVDDQDRKMPATTVQPQDEQSRASTMEQMESDATESAPASATSAMEEDEGTNHSPLDEPNPSPVLQNETASNDSQAAPMNESADVPETTSNADEASDLPTTPLSTETTDTSEQSENAVMSETPNGTARAQESTPPPVGMETSTNDPDMDTEVEQPTEPNHPNTESSRFDGMSIAELRSEGQARDIDLSGCLERDEMIQKLQPANRSLELQSLLADHSLAELVTLATMVGMDVRGDRDALLAAMSRETQQRPHTIRFIQALAPFVRLSVSQLRSVARERGIDVRDCLEKTDILRRLVHQS